MKNRGNFLIIVSIIVLFGCSSINENDLVIFDVDGTSLENIIAQDGANILMTDSSLIMNTTVKSNSSGVQFSGAWNFSKYNNLILELINYSDEEVDMQIFVQLENSEKALDKNEGVMIDQLIIPPGSSKHIISIPPKLPYPEIGEKLDSGTLRKSRNPYDFGMYEISGHNQFVFSLNPEEVTKLVIYLQNPKPGQQWGIKKINAQKSVPIKLPKYMQLPEDKFFPFIDIYGQFIHRDWPGKITSDNDLKTALDNETAEFLSNSESRDRSKYGGWLTGPRQKATGSFYVKKVENNWWLVDPEGYLYWSHGVCRVSTSSAVTPIDNRRFYFKDLPEKGSPFEEFYFTHNELLRPYFQKLGIKETYDFSAANIKRKYGDNWREKFSEMVHMRLKNWGLTTIANSSDRNICLMDNTPYCDRIELKSPDIEGSRDGWWRFKDPFHPDFRSNFRTNLLERKQELDDPWCIGFFVDNEISWGGTSDLAKWTLQSPQSQPAKKVLINHLRNKYNGITDLNMVWNSNYSGWDDLLKSTTPPTVDSEKDCMELTAIIVNEYFKNINEEFKKIAPDKLYLGCRFAGSRVNEDVAKIAANYCDVMSYNVYAYSLSEFKLPQGVDKPVLIGEFHFGALDRGLFHAGVRPTANQKERGEAYKTYVESALHHPNIVGTHWFQFSDQATTGRFDGECYQIGFTDVCDNPYPETIERVREVGYNMYQIRNSN